MSRSLRQSHPRPRRRAGHLGVPVLAGTEASPLPARLTALAQTIELTAEINRERTGGSP